MPNSSYVILKQTHENKQLYLIYQWETATHTVHIIEIKNQEKVRWMQVYNHLCIGFQFAENVKKQIDIKVSHIPMMTELNKRKWCKINKSNKWRGQLGCFCKGFKLKMITSIHRERKYSMGHGHLFVYFG